MQDPSSPSNSPPEQPLDSASPSQLSTGSADSVAPLEAPSREARSLDVTPTSAATPETLGEKHEPPAQEDSAQEPSRDESAVEIESIAAADPSPSAEPQAEHQEPSSEGVKTGASKTDDVKTDDVKDAFENDDLEGEDLEDEDLEDEDLEDEDLDDEEFDDEEIDDEDDDFDEDENEDEAESDEFDDELETVDPETVDPAPATGGASALISELGSERESARAAEQEPKPAPEPEPEPPKPLAPLDPLTAEQQAAVDARGGSIQLLGPAGSGKSYVIARRAAALALAAALENSADGEPANRAGKTGIVVLASDEAAVDRLGGWIGLTLAHAGRRGLEGVVVATPEQWAWRLIVKHVAPARKLTLLGDSQFIALAIRKRHELKLDKLDRNATKSLDQFLSAEAASESSPEATGETDRTPLGVSLKALEALLERGGWVTAPRATVRFLRFLESDGELLAKLRGELGHLLIDDEARLTALQRRLVDLLAPASVERFITVLETPAEGATSTGLASSPATSAVSSLSSLSASSAASTSSVTSEAAGEATGGIAAPTRFKLSVVQRSRPKIAIIARRMFSPRAVVSSKFAVRAGGECEIVPWSARTDEREVEVIADQIRDLQSVGWPYRSMAVLYRSLKPAATSLIRALEVRGIPYQCAGRSGLLLQPEARHLAEIYSWAGDGHWQDEPQSPVRPADMESAVRGLARLFRIAEIRLPDLYKHFESWKRSYRSPEKPITLREDFDAHLEAIGADRLTDATPRGASRLLTFARLWQLLDDYHQTMTRATERLNERTTAPSFGRGGDGAGRDRRGFDRGGRGGRFGGRDGGRGGRFGGGPGRFAAGGRGGGRDGMRGGDAPAARPRQAFDRGPDYWSGLAQYLFFFTRDSYEDSRPAAALQVDAVQLATCEQVAGREWPIVFLPSLVERRDVRVEPRDEREDREWFHVALTRARDAVYASAHQREKRPVQISPLLVEMAGMLGYDGLEQVAEEPIWRGSAVRREGGARPLSEENPQRDAPVPYLPLPPSPTT